MKQGIIPLIEEKWSPEQISGRLKRLEKPSVSHETVYRFVLTDKAAGGELYKHLRHQAKPNQTKPNQTLQ
jgi:transposase, IS30 family